MCWKPPHFFFFCIAAAPCALNVFLCDVVSPQANCYYHGQVEGRAGSDVSLSTCAGVKWVFFFSFFFNRAGSQLINISGGGGGCRGALNKNLGVISGRGSGAQLTFPAKWADLLPSLADCSAGSLSQSIFCFPWETLCNPTPPTSPRAREREREMPLVLSQRLSSQKISQPLWSS